MIEKEEDDGGMPVLAYHNYHSVPLNASDVESLHDYIAEKLCTKLTSFVFFSDMLLSPKSVLKAANMLKESELVHCPLKSPKRLEATIGKRILSDVNELGSEKHGKVILVSDTGHYDETLKALEDLGWNVTIFHPPHAYTAWATKGLELFPLPVSADNKENVPIMEANQRILQEIHESLKDLLQRARRLNASNPDDGMLQTGELPQFQKSDEPASFVEPEPTCDQLKSPVKPRNSDGFELGFGDPCEADDSEFSDKADFEDGGSLASTESSAPMQQPQFGTIASKKLSGTGNGFGTPNALRPGFNGMRNGFANPFGSPMLNGTHNGFESATIRSGFDRPQRNGFENAQMAQMNRNGFEDPGMAQCTPFGDGGESVFNDGGRGLGGGFQRPTFASTRPYGGSRGGFDQPDFGSYSRGMTPGRRGGGGTNRCPRPPQQFQVMRNPNNQQARQWQHLQPLQRSGFPEDRGGFPEDPQKNMGPVPPASAFPPLQIEKLEKSDENSVTAENGRMTYAQLASKIAPRKEHSMVEVHTVSEGMRDPPMSFVQSQRPASENGSIRVQCPHWMDRNHSNCGMFHPVTSCMFHPNCRNSAITCRFAHPYCANGRCPCNEKRRDPQLNHWTNGNWPSL